MNDIVVDASVAAKWVFPGKLEPLSRQAEQLLERHLKTEICLIVPSLFWTEIANFLWKAARVGKISVETASQGLQAAIAWDFATIDSRDVLDRALAIAIDFDRTVYDSIYVALALSRQTHLVTADERLVNALAGRLPVKWLGAV